MPFWRAIGLGIALVVFKLLVPNIWNGIESTLVQFFGVLADVVGLGSQFVANIDPDHFLALTPFQ